MLARAGPSIMGMGALTKRNGHEDGFTLVELLVVIVILGILIAIAVPSFLNQQDKANDASAKASLSTAYANAAADRIDNNGNFPDAATIASELTQNEPELGTVGTISNASDITATGALYVVSSGTPGNTGNFQAAIRSKSGNLCTVTVTGNKAPVFDCGQGSLTSATPDITGYQLASGPFVPAGATSTATCPSGKALGGGEEYAGTPNYATYLDSNAPSDVVTDPGWSVHSLSGLDIKAHAVCATVAGGVSVVTGPTVQGNSVDGALSTTPATATCPAGQSVIGGGFKVAGAFHAMVVSANYPSAPDTWTASVNVVYNASTPSAQEHLTAYAVCASQPSGYEIVPGGVVSSHGTAAGNTADMGPFVSSAACSPGKAVLSGGYLVSGNGDQVWQTHGISQSYATDNSTWSAGFIAPFRQSIRAYAICATV